jgi:two-component system sensor histidine kinase DesK
MMSVAATKTWVSRWLEPAPDSMIGRMREQGRSPWLALINIVWSGWVFSGAVFTPGGMTVWLSIAWSYPVFLLIYALLQVRPTREGGFYVAAFVILACINMPFNAAAWSYGVFACAFVPWINLRRGALACIVRMLFPLVPLIVTAIALEWPWGVMATMVAICLFVGLSSLMGQISVRKNLAERMSMREVRRLAASAERERIGRDLHDLLGHTLSLITLKLELSRKLFDHDAEAAKSELAEAEQVARKALAEVRAAVTGIRATGFAGELASAGLLLRASGVTLTAADMPLLPAAVDDTLALALREAVTNIHRHAYASHARVDVKLTDSHVHMRVRDDGRGGVDAHGNGLNGMRERVEGLGGTLAIDSGRDHGTDLRIAIPLPAAAVADDAQKGASANKALPVSTLERHAGSHA